MTAAAVSAHEALTSKDCAQALCTLEAEPGRAYCREHVDGGATQRRSRLAAEVRSLREGGLTHREIAARLGISRSYACSLDLDPDGSRERARKDGYRKPCPGCGRLMDGSGGATATPTRCADCAAAGQHEERLWTPEAVVERLCEFARVNGRAPTSTDAQIKAPSVREQMSPERVAEGDRFVAAVPLPAHWTVVREFGSWTAALAAAGLEQPLTGGAAHRAPQRRWKEPRQMNRRFLVLRRCDDGSYTAAEIEARTPDAAIEQAADGEGVYVAVPETQWHERRVRTITRLAVVREDAA